MAAIAPSTAKTKVPIRSMANSNASDFCRIGRIILSVYEDMSYNQFYGLMSLLLQGGLLISAGITSPA